MREELGTDPRLRVERVTDRATHLQLLSDCRRYAGDAEREAGMVIEHATAPRLIEHARLLDRAAHDLGRAARVMSDAGLLSSAANKLGLGAEVYGLMREPRIAPGESMRDGDLVLIRFPARASWWTRFVLAWRAAG